MSLQLTLKLTFPHLSHFPSIKFNMKMLQIFLFLSVINVLSIASHYIVPWHIDSTVLGLSKSWYTITSITSNTHINHWSQGRPTNPCCWCLVWDVEGKVNGDQDADQSLDVDHSISHCYYFALVNCVLIISKWQGRISTQLFKCNVFVFVL